MESWRLVLRHGFLPQWHSDRLLAVLPLLDGDSPFLTQGSTSTPPPLMCVQDWPTEACDLVAYCSHPDPHNSTVGEIEEAFAQACFQADQTLGEPAACRRWLNWWDDTPRTECFRLVAEEIRSELARRPAVAPELAQAMATFPDDDVLKRAVFDHLLYEGASVEHARIESGWRGE